MPDDVGGYGVTRRQLKPYVLYKTTNDGTLWDWSGEEYNRLGQVESSEGHIVIYPTHRHLAEMPKYSERVEGMKLAISAFPLEDGYSTWDYVYIPEDVESSDLFITNLDDFMERIHEEACNEGAYNVDVLPLGMFSYHDGGLQYDSDGYDTRDEFLDRFG